MALFVLGHHVQGGHSPGKPGKPGIVGNLRVVREKSGKKGKVREMCSCMWPLTACIVLDTKCARKGVFTR